MILSGPRAPVGYRLAAEPEFGARYYEHQQKEQAHYRYKGHLDPQGLRQYNKHKLINVTYRSSATASFNVSRHAKYSPV